MWRQSYDNPPPKIDFDHEMHPRFEDMYKHLPHDDHKQMPKGESLKMVRERIEPFWKDQIFPTFKNFGGEKAILFVAHEHVLRGMV